jgi:hypothetical protein
MIVKLGNPTGPKPCWQWRPDDGNWAVSQLLKSTSVLSAITFWVNRGISHWDKELRAIRTVSGVGIGTSAYVIYP